MLNLNEQLRAWGISKADLAQGVGVSRSAISVLCRHGRWPTEPARPALRRAIEEWLRERLATTGQPLTEPLRKSLWRRVAAQRPSASPTGDQTPHDLEETIDMLPRKHTLSPPARQHFRLFRSPFGDVETDGDLFLSGAVRYSREFVLEKVRNGGFGAVIGESGSGKTTLMEEVETYLTESQAAATLIRPLICGMDTGKEKGAPLRARSILLTILDAVAPATKRPADLPRLTETVRRLLADRREGERRFCLVIDDAHRLNGHTLNHLKDFYELKLGRQRLLGIVLLGQLRLGQRLDPHDPEVHQITQRCEVHYLPPLGADLEAYVARRCQAVGRDAAELFAPDVYPALRARLSGRASEGPGGRRQVTVDLTYPLAVNNLLTAGLNAAADPDFALPQVTGAVIEAV